MEHLARHVGGILAGKEEKARSHLARLARTAHRDVLAEILDLLGRLASERIERSPDRARSDRVHPDAVADEIFRKRAGKGGDRALGRAVVEQELRALVHGDRGAVDDRRALFEMRARRLGHEEHSEDVGLEGALQLLLADLPDVLVPMLLAGIVDEYVE